MIVGYCQRDALLDMFPDVHVLIAAAGGMRALFPARASFMMEQN